MAISAFAFDNAEWTFSDSVETVRNDQGGFIQQRAENPWALVRFLDPTEPFRYIVPINGAAWPMNGLPPGRIGATEVMPYLPWPLESARPARTSDSRDVNNAGGPVAIHFYGWI